MNSLKSEPFFVKNGKLESLTTRLPLPTSKGNLFSDVPKKNLKNK